MMATKEYERGEIVLKPQTHREQGSSWAWCKRHLHVRQVKHDLKGLAGAFMSPKPGNSKWELVDVDFPAEKTGLIFN